MLRLRAHRRCGGLVWIRAASQTQRPSTGSMTMRATRLARIDNGSRRRFGIRLASSTMMRANEYARLAVIAMTITNSIQPTITMLTP